MLLAPLPARATDWHSDPWKSWAAEHPDTRIGAVIAADGRTASPDDLLRALERAAIVILGETHDNAEHHRLQAYLVDALARGDRKPAVVMEMIGADKSEALARVLLGKTPTPEAIAAALAWAESGWPAWVIYRPIAEAALAHSLPIMAGDAARATIRTVGKTGAPPVGTPEPAGLDRPLGAGLEAALDAELQDGHCGLLPDQAIPRMRLVQRFRDATLADAVVHGVAAGGGQAILIAGAGHARNDRGVPFYLAGRVPPGAVVSVVLVEVASGARADPMPRDPTGAAAADYAVITPRAAREDPCAGLAERLRQGRQAPAP